MFGGILNTLLKSWELLEIFASLTIISFSKCYKYKYDFYTFELIRDIPTSICIVRIAFKRNVFGYVDTYVLYSSMTSCPYTILFQPLKWPHSIDRITCIRSDILLPCGIRAARIEWRQQDHSFRWPLPLCFAASVREGFAGALPSLDRRDAVRFRGGRVARRPDLCDRR